MTNSLILIVDDEAGLLTLYAGIIRRLDYEVVEAPGGAEAIAILKETTPDLLILDMAMPRVSGRDVLDFIETAPHLETMRIMVLTALGPGAAQVDGASERVDEWINKPIRPSEFRDIICDLMGDTE